MAKVQARRLAAGGSVSVKKRVVVAAMIILSCMQIVTAAAAGGSGGRGGAGAGTSSSSTAAAAKASNGGGVGFKPLHGGSGSGNSNSNKKGPEEGLSLEFYRASCPQVEQVIEQKLKEILHQDPGQAAGILRIMFHDCFVQGCDASILLVKPVTEQTATPNNASIRASSLRALDEIKASIEEVCPGVVSCADTIILSTKIAVQLSGGPTIPMQTGRRDSLSAASNQTVVNNIPPPTLNISALKQNFQNHGLDIKDLVSLSGGHSLGQAHCRFVDPQITPTVSTDLNIAFARNLSRICLPSSNPAKARLTVHLDFITKDLFDNAYFNNILAKTAIFHTDATLMNASDTAQLVHLYAQNQPLFFQQFSVSMVKMSQLGVLTGQQGVIRKECTIPN